MTPAEAAELLTCISVYDNREVNRPTAGAWAATLPDVSLADALAVLPDYYRAATRTSRNWIYPGDVLGLVAARHERLRAEALRDVWDREEALGTDRATIVRLAAAAEKAAVPVPVRAVEASA